MISPVSPEDNNFGENDIMEYIAVPVPRPPASFPAQLKIIDARPYAITEAEWTASIITARKDQFYAAEAYQYHQRIRQHHLFLCDESDTGFGLEFWYAHAERLCYVMVVESAPRTFASLFLTQKSDLPLYEDFDGALRSTYGQDLIIIGNTITFCKGKPPPSKKALIDDPRFATWHRRQSTPGQGPLVRTVRVVSPRSGRKVTRDITVFEASKWETIISAPEEHDAITAVLHRDESRLTLVRSGAPLWWILATHPTYRKLAIVKQIGLQLLGALEHLHDLGLYQCANICTRHVYATRCPDGTLSVEVSNLDVRPSIVHGSRMADRGEISKISGDLVGFGMCLFEISMYNALPVFAMWAPLYLPAPIGPIFEACVTQQPGSELTVAEVREMFRAVPPN